METQDDDTGSNPSGPDDLSRLGEFGLIGKIRKAATSGDMRVIRGIGDDAAVLSTQDKILVTTDLLVEKIHFLIEKTTPRLLGRKALSVNLSDMAAMAATPCYALLGLAAPPSFDARTMDEIIAGMLERAREAGVSLVGGDVCRSADLVLAVTVIGEAGAPAPVYRSGAGTGDQIFITGVVGDSALGLARLLELPGPLDREAIESDPLSGPIMAHLDPPARIETGEALAGVATSMIDLSDGIISDLTHILEESGLAGATIESGRIPVSRVLRSHFSLGDDLAGEALRLAVAGGEDYELLFTAPTGSEQAVAEIARRTGVSITRIGAVSSEPGIRFKDKYQKDVPVPAPVFEHFPQKEREQED